MYSRSKKGQEWEERMIGFGKWDKDYGTIFMLFFATYHPFINVGWCYFINVMELELKHYTNVIKGVLIQLIIGV